GEFMNTINRVNSPTFTNANMLKKGVKAVIQAPMVSKATPAVNSVMVNYAQCLPALLDMATKFLAKL
ncbi:MAG: hypothetical protein AB7V50_11565, partial [Vampirovibrionia bacterium]